MLKPNIRFIQCLPVVLLLLGGSFPSLAIIVRHDVRPDSYIVNVSDYPAVFFLEKQGSRRVCAATVIHPRWAISAAHCAQETSLGNTIENRRRFAVTVAGKTREIDAAIVHPQFDMTSSTDVDLVLLRFAEASDTPQPYPLIKDANELGAVVRLVGWGYFGVGITGRQFDDGKLRMAKNRVSAIRSRLRIKFDDPRLPDESPLDLEGMPSLGDSGGPALLESERGLVLAGIAVGEIQGPDYSEETQGKYGSIAVYERLSLHIDWIETVIGSKLPFDS
ncbi:MAG: trypsin-like serine protease [Pseudohongiellaceae bacterium]